MKSKFLQLCLISGLLSFGSCVGDDIDDLQDQIDDLTEQVGEIEKAQQDALLAEIAKLEALIAELQVDNSELSDDYAALLVNLQVLEDEVANNASAVYYGNLLTDADFAAVLSQGATIVTGKVVATNQTHIDALAAVKMIGGNLSIHGGTTITLPMLENVAGSLRITEVEDADALVSLPVLASVGSEMDIMNNKGVVSVDAPVMVLIYDDLTFEANAALTTVSMAKLDAVGGDLYINEMNWDTPDNNGNLVNLDLSSTGVEGSVTASYLGLESTLALGVVKGDLTCEGNGFSTLEVLNETFYGNMTINNNGTLATISLPNMTRIEGDLNIKSNSAGGFIGGGTSMLADLSAFDNIEYIGGNVDIRSNIFSSLDAFNSVTEVAGSSISIVENGNEMTFMNVFNALTSTGPSQWSNADITISQKTEWFTSFIMLEKANIVDLVFQVTMDAEWNQGDVCKVEGFDAMTEVKILKMELTEVTEFTSFPLLNNFTHYNEYLYINVPKDETAGMCSMADILTRIKNGEFDNEWNENKKAVFFDAWNWVDLDRDTAIDRLLAPCI